MHKTGRNGMITGLLFIVLMTCTSNPFFKDDTITGKGIFKGHVELSHGGKAQGVLVWFEQSGLTARTDSTGHFELTLPPPAVQEGGGWTGQYTCYFYLSGFCPDSVQIWLLDGEVEWGKGGVDDKGSLYQPIHLLQNVEAALSFDPCTFFADFNGAFTGNLTLAVRQKAVQLKIPYMWRNNIITRYILKKRGEEPGFPKFIQHPFMDGSTENIFKLYPGDEVHLTLPVVWPPLAGREMWHYEPGLYGLTPCIWEEPRGLPQGMIEEINAWKTFDAHYLEAPVHPAMGWVEILQDSSLKEF